MDVIRVAHLKVGDFFIQGFTTCLVIAEGNENFMCKPVTSNANKFEMGKKSKKFVQRVPAPKKAVAPAAPVLVREKTCEAPRELVVWRGTERRV